MWVAKCNYCDQSYESGELYGTYSQAFELLYKHVEEVHPDQNSI